MSKRDNRESRWLSERYTGRRHGGRARQPWPRRPAWDTVFFHGLGDRLFSIRPARDFPASRAYASQTMARKPAFAGAGGEVDEATATIERALAAISDAACRPRRSTPAAAR